ncbi:MAG: ABC transporter permease [Armatimonadetes bacterium]|nr:ABC transporter permease [Armatimonadota bacterium]
MQKASPLPDAAASGRNSSGWLTGVMRSREMSVLAVLGMLGLYMVWSPARQTFYSARNIQNVLLNTSLLGIFSIGETVVIITAGIDLSLGSLIGFSGMVLAGTVTLLDQRLYTLAAVLLGIVATAALALVLGWIHTNLIHKLRLPAFVVTLVSLLVLRSQALVMNHHQQIVLDPVKYPLFNWLANGNIGRHFPIPTVVLILVAVVTHTVLTRTRMGRYLYSVGSNEQATELSGVNVFRVKLFAYTCSALLGCLAGILYAGYGGQGDPQAGLSYELNAVAAAVVGGANLFGGQGSVLGTVLGATLLYTILSAINLLLTQPSLWEGTVVGGVLLFAVLTTAIRERRAAR